MVEVSWTEQALEDLDAVCLFIARDSPRVAEIFAERVLDATARLARFPASGRIVPELALADVREVFVYSYRVIYRLGDLEIEVLSIHHGARRLGNLDRGDE